MLGSLIILGKCLVVLLAGWMCNILHAFCKYGLSEIALAKTRTEAIRRWPRAVDLTEKELRHLNFHANMNAKWFARGATVFALLCTGCVGGSLIYAVYVIVMMMIHGTLPWK